MNTEMVYDKLYRYVYFKVKNVELAEDIVQESFIRYFERYSDGSFYNMKLLYTIAKNLCVDEYRKPTSIHLKENYATKTNPELNVDNLDLKDALKTLSKEERELLLLRFVNEESMQTISKVFGCSRFAIYRKIKLATKKLLKHF